MTNFGEIVRFWDRWRPDETALSHMGTTVTWRELDRRASALADGLQNRGLKHGDRLGLLMLNRIEFVEVVVACMYLGAICVPFNTRLTPAEIAFQADDAGISLVISEATTLNGLHEVRAAKPDLPVFVAGEGDDGTQSYEALIAHGGSVAVSLSDTADDDPLFICYTSGTTGFPKGATLTHGSWKAAMIARSLALGITWADTILLPFALAVTSGINMAMIALFTGSRLVIESDFEPGRTLGVIAKEEVTVLMAPNIFHEQMAAHQAFATTDLSSLRVVLTGGSPVSEGLLNTFLERGVRMLETRGDTESSGLGITVAPRDAYRKRGSAGIAGPWTQTRISVDGKEVGRGEVGELCLKGPMIMQGYWNRPEVNAERIIDGWYHTGDLGIMDDEGYIQLVGRATDMIISGGFNIYPAELEKVLGEHPSVTQVAVIGVPDEKWSETPAVYAYTEGRPFTGEDVLTALRPRVAGYKLPRYLVVTGDPLPVNLTGKITKNSLREHFDALLDNAQHRIR
jgi:fatty-acyl-CoA synthase